MVHIMVVIDDEIIQDRTLTGLPDISLLTLETILGVITDIITTENKGLLEKYQKVENLFLKKYKAMTGKKLLNTRYLIGNEKNDISITIS